MSEPTTSNVTIEGGRRINLRILSPAQELAGGITFSDLPLSTTIAELKLKIQTITPSRPPTQRLRVINHGQYCRDEETLEQVFARSPEESSRVLHVVISDPLTTRVPHLAQGRPASAPIPIRTPSLPHAAPPTIGRVPTPSQAMPGRGALYQHPSRPNTPGQLPGQPINQAELINSILNQQMLAAHMPMAGNIPRVHAGFAGPFGQTGTTPPAMLFPPPAGLPVNATPEQMAMHQANLTQLQQLHAAEYQQHMRNAMGARNMPPPTAPSTTADTANAITTPDSNDTDRGGVNHAPTTPQTLDAPPMNATPLPGAGMPQTETHTTTGIGPDGQRFTMTVHNSVIGYRQIVPGQPHMPPNMTLGHPTPGANQPVPHMPPSGFMPSSTGQPAHPFFIPRPNLHPIAPGIALPPRRSSQTTISGEQHGRHMTDTMVVLSAQLYNVSRLIQNIGGRIVSSRLNTRTGAIRETISYLQSIEDAESQLRSFDYHCSQYVAMNPEALTNPQYIQTQERRRGAGAALARIFEMVRTDVMIPMMPSSNTASIPVSHTATTPPPPESTSQLSNTIDPQPLGSIPTTSNDPRIFILNDQHGSPYALLVGPNGQHASGPLPWNLLQPLLSEQVSRIALFRALSTASGGAYAQTINDFRGLNERSLDAVSLANLRRRLRNARDSLHAQTSRRQPVQEGNPNPGEPQGVEAAGAAAPAAQAQVREPDEMRDMLAPIIRNLWLLVRIVGFTYLLFGGGRALWRPLLLGIGLTVIWAAQAGMFGHRFDGVRRYLDRLVGIEPPQPEAEAQINGDNNRQAGNNGNVGGEINGAQNGLIPQAPDPQTMARRLMAQRQQEEATWLMQQVRYVERMFGLFLASLWPGIGEQAVRLQEERERRIREEEEEARAALEMQRHEENARVAITSTEATESLDNIEQDNDTVTEELQPSSKDGAGSSFTAAATGVAHGTNEETTESSLSRVNKGKGRASETT